MKKNLLSFVVFIAIIIASCKNGGSDPKTTLLSFFEAMSKKDFTEAKKYATKESDGMFSIMEMGMKMDKDNKDSKMDKFDKSKMEFGEPKIDGDKATIEVKDKEKGEGINFIMKKENGDWKVAFDKASMTQMATDKMKEKGVDASGALDSLGKITDKLKNINTDSLSGKMKEGLEKLNVNKEKIEEIGKKLEEVGKKLDEKK